MDRAWPAILVMANAYSKLDYGYAANARHLAILFRQS